MSTEQDDLPRRLVPVWVALCCIATLVAKLVVNAERTQVNHGDISFYYAVTKNLAEGRGFVIDYIWNFWNHPEGIPAPSNVWWMPLACVIGAVGMWFGQVDYWSAQLPMIVLTSVLPLAIYLLGAETFRDRRIGLLGATLASTFHLFLDQPSALLSHGPYVVLSALTLWLIVRSLREPSSLKWVGATIALAQLARSDAIVLFGPLLLFHLVHRNRPPWRSILSVPIAYAIVMSPWWIHNLGVHGALMPGGSFRAVFLKNYEYWYSLPESVTYATWVAQGWDEIWRAKLSMSLTNLESFISGLAVGAPERAKAWSEPVLVTTLAFSWLGMLATLRKRFVAFWSLAVLEWTFYSLVFTAVGMESFRSGMFSLYPMLLLCAAAGMLLLARGLARAARLLPGPSRWSRNTVSAGLLLLVAWVVAGQFAFSQRSIEKKVRGITNLNIAYTALRRQVFDRMGLSDAVVMTRDVHQLNAIAGMKGVMIPYEPEPVIRRVARQYGVTHLLVVGEPSWMLRPMLDGIDANPHFRRIAGPLPVPPTGIRFTLYEFVSYD